MGERVLIVGGSSGMGKATARAVLARGGEALIVGRDPAKLAAARAELGDGEAVVADITREDVVADLFERLGAVDHIVCTAADIEGAYRLLPDLELTAVRRAIDSKLIGPLLLAKHGASRLRAGGSITLVSGIAAYRPSARGAAVAAVNGALQSLVYALAVELGPIRVNAVSPGWIATPIWKFVAGDAAPAMLEAMAQRLPVGRTGLAEDIAQAILFAMDNGFVTGTTLHVDGGHRLV